MRALIVMTLMGLAPSAWADKVPPPPDECPAGARPFTSHNGIGCEPMPCKADGDCAWVERDNGAPFACKPVALCVSTDTIRDHRGGDHTYTRDVVHGTCAAGEACVAGSCSQTSRCVPRGTESAATTTEPPAATSEPTQATSAATNPPIGSTPKGCGTCAGGAGGGLLGLLVLLVRRRR